MDEHRDEDYDTDIDTTITDNACVKWRDSDTQARTVIISS